MAVAIVPNAEVLSTGALAFVLRPNPTVPLYQTEPRIGINPMLYETISPTMTITVTGTGTCGPLALPELITSITILPGQGVGGVGAGCSIVSLSEIAASYPGTPPVDIPQMLIQGGFLEPSMVYGTVISPGAPTLALVAPLRGFYGEKYFYDAEYIYASYYRNSPALDPVDGTIAPNAPITRQNRLTSVSLLEGKKQMPFSAVPPLTETITDDSFTGPQTTITPINFLDFVPVDPASAITIGNDYFTGLVPEVSSWVKWKPSFIEIMRYNYTLVVTHTCPPFVTVFQGYMLVQNNWTPAANRLTYYINLQNGFLDVENANP